MARIVRLLLPALLALASCGMAGELSAQTFTLPETGLENSGTCPQFAVRERSSKLMVPLGCLDVASRTWSLTPARVTSSEVDVGSTLRLKSNGKTGGVLQAGVDGAGNPFSYLASRDKDTGALVNSVTVSAGGVNIAGYFNNFSGGTFLNPMTYGGNAEGTGHVFAANGLIYGIPNYINQPANLNNYASRDHAGATRSMRAPFSKRVVDGGITFTANSVTSPALAMDARFRVGMVIDTLGTPRYSGVITAINTATKTFTVNGWYTVGGPPNSTGLPTAGTGVLINPASKLWISNDILSLGEPRADSDAHDIAGAGTELNINIQSNRVVEVYGYDAVIFGQHSPEVSYGFPARSVDANSWRAAVYGYNNRGGFLSEQTAGVPSSFTVPLLETKVGADAVFNMNHSGRMNALRLQSVATASSMTLDRFVGAKVITTQNANISITLPSPSDVNDGREIEVVNLGAPGTTVTVVTHLGTAIPNGIPSQYSQRVYAFQNNWYAISKTPTN